MSGWRHLRSRSVVLAHANIDTDRDLNEHPNAHTDKHTYGDTNEYANQLADINAI